METRNGLYEKEDKSYLIVVLDNKCWNTKVPARGIRLVRTNGWYDHEHSKEFEGATLIVPMELML